MSVSPDAHGRAGGHPAAGTAAPRKLSLSSLLAAVGALIIGATVVSAVLDITRAREATIGNRLRELSNLSRALTEQTDRSVQAVDVVVRETAHDELFAASRRPQDSHALFLRLRQSIAAMPQVRDLEILGPGGIVEYRSSEFPAEHLARGNRRYFTVQRRDPPATGYFSKAFRSEIDEQWTLALSRRIDGPGGQFLGAVVATLDLRYFERFYEAIRLPAGSFISLYGSDGVLLARDPRAESAIGRSFAGLSFFGQLHGSATASSTRFRSPLDGEPKLFAAQRVAGWPLVVGVGLSEDVALAPWSEQALHTALRTLLLSASVALLIGLVIRQLKQREQAAARLRESEERYALAMAGSNEGHWDWDLRARRIYLSARMLALSGERGDDLVTGDDWLQRLDLVHPEDRARRRAALIDHLKGRTAQYECEYRVRDRIGGYRWLLDRGLGLRDARGRVYRMAGAITDITERKLAEAERVRLERRLRQAEKLEALGTMAGGIAHDFNNILGAILGYGDMAVHAASEGSALKRYTSNVMTAANRAKNLVDQILAYSRSGRGRRDAVDARAVVEETMELVRASLPGNVDLDVQLHAAGATVIADSTQLHQVVMNLSTNAIQAMPNGGGLTVGLDAVEAATDAVLSHGVLPAGRYLRVSVSDTGCGISPQILPHIFEPFFTTKDPGVGTGLGLALVHGIVTDLGGTLHVVTGPGGGSRFDVYLPRAEPAVRAADADLPVAHGRGERVMLIEDERPLLLLGEEMLAALGYDPAGYTEPDAALAALAADPSSFDLIVTDHLLPSMTGTQLAARARRLARNIPILLISGYRSPALEQEARAAGIEAILGKPMRSRELAQAIVRALTAQSAAAG